MQTDKFKNRKKETNEMKETLNKKGFAFEIIYGRRRVGKTELVLNSIKSLKNFKNKNYIYYLATEENNLERFYNVCVNHDSNVSKLKKDYEILFDYLKDKVDIIVLDEFQNFIKENSNFLNLLQSIIDTNIKHSNLKLIVLGSSVSIISSKVLGYKSPLYGRKTASLNLKPVSFFDLKQFFPNLDIDKLIEIYGFADGIPYYLNKIERDFWKWFEKEINSDKGFLKDEVDFLMKFEFEDSSTHKLILQAIAAGKNTIKEIRDFTRLQRTDISPYLRNLMEVGLVKREIPFNENVKSRKGRYFLQDNFVKFWFRYIYPNLSSIEQGIYRIQEVKSDYSEYLGKIFEDICKEYLTLTNFNFSKLERWWHKDNEIDIIGLGKDSGKKTIYFTECKYKKNVNPERILNKLSEKKDFFKLHNKDYYKKIENKSLEEGYIIFAKSFEKKINNFKGKKVFCFDLNDLKKKLT
ncbi:MAG: ATP-binding protein [Minisyncoccales bacterium]